MRFAAVATALLLAGCSLDLFEGDDSTPIADDVVDPPPAACALAPRYRIQEFDCGPQPPDSPPPTDCWWTLSFSGVDMRHCWSDICETLTYECAADRITARNAIGDLYTGELLPNGNLYWERPDYHDGEYMPY